MWRKGCASTQDGVSGSAGKLRPSTAVNHVPALLCPHMAGHLFHPAPSEALLFWTSRNGASAKTALRARGRLRHVRMRRWRCDPDLNIRLATGGALDRPALVDEAPVPAEVAREPGEVDVACVRPPGVQARSAEHERAHAVVDELAEGVDHSRVSGLGHGRFGRAYPSRSPASRRSSLDWPCSGTGGAGWSAARLPINQSKFGPGRITTTSSDRTSRWSRLPARCLSHSPSCSSLPLNSWSRRSAFACEMPPLRTAFNRRPIRRAGRRSAP